MASRRMVWPQLGGGPDQMPYSAPVFDRHIEALIERMRPASILDIGPGAGKYGRMARALQGRGVDIGALSAIEIDPSYIDHFRLNDVYDLVQLGDASALPDTHPDAQWDLVMLGDVLEHFRKSRGVDLVDYLYYRTKYIVAIVPIDFIQGAWQGHAAEAHISTWEAQDFSRYKATCLSASFDSSPDIQLMLVNGLRADPAHDFIFARDLRPSGIFGG
jgi:SAM-dependent methyltransferase